jgi:hypothetical protein
VLTLSRREQRHGFGKEVEHATASSEDRHRVRRSNISAFAEIGSIRLLQRKLFVNRTSAFAAGSSTALTAGLTNSR